MKIRELKTKTAEERRALLKSLQGELGRLRFKVANKQLKDVREIRQTRKTVAQLLTLLKEEYKK